MDKETLERRNYSLLYTGDYSDITITTAARHWPVHRAIICPQSGFFKAACKEGFKVKPTTKREDPSNYSNT